MQSHLELAPGEYELRVAVSDPATGKVASVFSDVTVPKFESAALSLSGIAVDTASAPSAAPAPTTRRVFQRDERVRACCRSTRAPSAPRPSRPVSMRVRILDAKGGAVRDQSLPFTEQTFTNRRADCVITIPVAELPPGEGLVEARGVDGSTHEPDGRYVLRSSNSGLIPPGRQNDSSAIGSIETAVLPRSGSGAPKYRSAKAMNVGHVGSGV